MDEAWIRRERERQRVNVRAALLRNAATTAVRIAVREGEGQREVFEEMDRDEGEMKVASKRRGSEVGEQAGGKRVMVEEDQVEGQGAQGGVDQRLEMQGAEEQREGVEGLHRAEEGVEGRGEGEEEGEVARLRAELAARTMSEAAARGRYEELVTQLAAKVECPVCFEVPRQAPIHSCPNGHLVCRTCRRDTCPTCRVRLGPATSLLAVTVIEHIPHRCEFELNGCSARLGLAELEAHHRSCGHRTVRCPNFSCTEKVPLVGLAEHTLRRCIHSGTFFNSPLSNNYNYIIKASQVEQFDRRHNSTWRPDGLVYDDRNFFLKITRKGKKGSWYFSVQMAGSEAEGAGYTATIHVFKTHAGPDSRNSHRFIGEVCPIDVTSMERAAEGGFCLILTGWGCVGAF